MTTYQSTLFFGIPVEPNLSTTFQTNPLYSHYIQEQYLHECDVHGTHYVGKQIGGLTDLDQLIKLQEHIRSLLVKLAPNASLDSLSLQLIPLSL